jgi:phospholipid transport system substrate-binding protein
MHATRRHILVIMLTFLPFLGLSMSLDAAPDPKVADETVTGFAEEMWQVLQSEDLSETEQVDQLAAIIDANTDTALLGRLALGRHWNQLSEEQQQRYAEHFPGFITHLLASRLIGATGRVEGTFEDMFKILGAKAVSDDDTVVRTEIMRPDSQQPVAVDWRLRDNDGKLAIIDLAVDQVSLLVTQRSEFASVIERGSIDDLLAQLETNGGA